MKPRLLDLFCCEGGAATGYYRAGFDVVGVDVKPQPRYPFPFIQADALELLDSMSRAELMFYAAIHASPPCQRWATGTHDPSRHPDLIDPVRQRLRRIGLPYVIENVRGAPLRDHVMICGGGLGLTHGDWQLHRHRYFETSFPLFGVPCARQKRRVMSVVGHGTPSGMRREGERDPGVADRRAIMEMPWASRAGTSEAIPPRYTEHIGVQLMAELESARAPSH
jgi:DNA (cytosine-5)-methyltransferase 1